MAQRLAYSPARRKIVEGLIEYRRELAALGFVEGFQWLDGSFVENIEALEGRDPGDVDVITFFRRPASFLSDDSWEQLWPNVSHLFNRIETKKKFKVDAFAVDMDEPPEQIVSSTRFWFGLFTHKRVTRQWKGMLQIPLSVGAQDVTAMNLLHGKLES